MSQRADEVNGEQLMVIDMHVDDLPPVNFADESTAVESTSPNVNETTETPDMDLVTAEQIANVLRLYRTAGGFVTRRPHLWTVDESVTTDLASRLEAKVNNSPFWQKTIGTVDEQSVYFHLGTYLGTPLLHTVLEVRAERAEQEAAEAEAHGHNPDGEVNPIWHNQLR